MAKLTTKNEIRSKLDSIESLARNGGQFSLNDREWLTRSLMAIYEGQTSQEKLAMVTTEDNGIGFNGVDAEILTSFANQWRSQKWLSYKQLVVLAKKMPKYSGQLAKIAAAKLEASTVTADISDQPVDKEGNVLFPDGTFIQLTMMAPQYYGGELVAWRAEIEGKEYLLVND